MTEPQLIERLEQDLKKAKQMMDFAVMTKDIVGGALATGKMIYIEKLLDELRDEQTKADLNTLYQNEKI